MKAVVLEKPGSFVLADRPDPPAPQAGQALVAIQRVGVCGTDLHAFAGRQPFFSYPRVVGHELGVEVVAVGPDVQRVAPGDRCAVEPYLNCGRCIACRRGRPNCCISLQCLGVHTDGGMCQYYLLPAAKLHRSPALSFDQLALVETLGIGAHAVARGQPQAGEGVLVIGAGPIGMAAMQFAAIEGATVVGMDTNPQRLEFCRRNIGIRHTLDGGGDIAAGLRDILGDLPTLVLDATGNAQSMMRAFQYVAHGGRLVFVGLFQGDVTFHDPDFHRREMTLLATRNSTAAEFHRIIPLLEQGRIDVRPWITHRAPLDQVPARFPDWVKPESAAVKPIVEV